MTQPLDTGTLYKVSVSPVSHFYAVIEPTNTTGWYKYYTQKRARQAHPYLHASVSMTESEWLEAVHKRATPVVLNEQTAVPSEEEMLGRLYLRCANCLEVFEADEPRIAYEHHWTLNACARDQENYELPTFELVTEEEAF